MQVFQLKLCTCSQFYEFCLFRLTLCVLSNHNNNKILKLMRLEESIPEFPRLSSRRIGLLSPEYWSGLHCPRRSDSHCCLLWKVLGMQRPFSGLNLFTERQFVYFKIMSVSDSCCSLTKHTQVVSC